MNMKLKSKKVSRKKCDEFLATIANIFKIARFFGISNYGFNLAFVWTLTIFIMLISLVATAFWKFIRMLDGWATNTSAGRGFISRLSGSMFYGNVIISLVLTCKFVSSWKRLSTHWRRVETKECLRFTPDPSIRWKATAVSAFIGACAFTEHILSMLSSTGLDCPPSEFFKKYILVSHGFLMRKNEYRIWFAIPIFILSKVATLLWNFQDLLIILISMGLTSRYNRLNTYIEHIVRIEGKLSNTPKTRTDMHVHIEIWRRIRQAYVRQAELVRMVDRELGLIVLLSNINNLYFICLQLFLGLNASFSGPLIDKLYYFISLGWLLFRACSVVLAASNVHLHSKRGLVHLYSCPKSAFNIEAKRLKHQLTHEYVALSGMGLFSLNRQLLLQVAAAVLKYELVLIQYDK